MILTKVYEIELKSQLRSQMKKMNVYIVCEKITLLYFRKKHEFRSKK